MGQVRELAIVLQIWYVCASRLDWIFSTEKIQSKKLRWRLPLASCRFVRDVDSAFR